MKKLVFVSSFLVWLITSCGSVTRISNENLKPPLLYVKRSEFKITEDLLTHIFEIVENAEKQKEVEEITENIVIIFSHFVKELKEQFKPIFEKLASPEKKPGLSSRTKFKYMDLIGK